MKKIFVSFTAIDKDGSTIISNIEVGGRIKSMSDINELQDRIAEWRGGRYVNVVITNWRKFD